MSFVGDIVGALIGADASRKASNTQADSVRETNALQKQMFDLTREDQKPYREAGYGALEQIQNLLKNPNSITSEPGYQFGMDQGTRALNSGAAARGMTYSGAAGKALTRYGQDYAGTKLDQSYNRLASLAGLGQIGANGQNNQNFASQVGNNLTGLANAKAGASMYNARQWGNAANSLANWASSKWGSPSESYEGWGSGGLDPFGPNGG